MAADTGGLLDVLGFGSAHLVGASLGGMIAQTTAIEYPDRVRSLTSMLSTTGDPSVGQPNFSTIGPLGAPPEDRQGYIDWQVRAFRAVGSPGFEFDKAAVAVRSYLTRSCSPGGHGRSSSSAALRTEFGAS